MTATLAKHSVAFAASATPNQSKFRQPIRRLPLSKSHICRDGRHSEANGRAHLEIVSTSSILCNLRRSYVSRGISKSDWNGDELSGKNLAVTPQESTRMDVIRPSLGDSLRSSSVHVNDKAIDCSSAKCFNSCQISNGRRSISPLKLSSPSTYNSDESGSDDDESVVSSTTSNSDESFEVHKQKRSYSIRFQSYVKVVEIPNRHSYTAKQRRRMWNNHKEIRSNAKRNRIEYQWEGPNWQDAVEEDQYCDVGGQKIHPAHAFPHNTC